MMVKVEIHNERGILIEGVSEHPDCRGEILRLIHELMYDSDAPKLYTGVGKTITIKMTEWKDHE